MTPKLRPEDDEQGELFGVRLDGLVNRKHELVQLSEAIDWDVFVARFGATYDARQGRPAVPIRLMVGLHYLKHMHNQSDESAVATLLENPYWQLFCGYVYFQHEIALDPSSMSRWRRRHPHEDLALLLTETVEMAKRAQLMKANEMERVVADTTVQPKAVAYPTDARLYHKARVTLVRHAEQRGIDLRQTYRRLGKQALARQGRYAHAKQGKRAAKETRKLKTYLGRVIRDITRKCPNPDATLQTHLDNATSIFQRHRHQQDKLYSMHAPEVECIAKGKAHRPYEFGCKVAFTVTAKTSWILGAQAVHGRPFDGHTLDHALDDLSQRYGVRPAHVYADRGYRGAHKHVRDVAVHLAGHKPKTLAAKRWMRRRSAVEPVIGHTKSDHRMERNHLRGQHGDHVNALLAACGFNLRKAAKALAALLLRLFRHRPLALHPTCYTIVAIPTQPLLLPF